MPGLRPALPLGTELLGEMGDAAAVPQPGTRGPRCPQHGGSPGTAAQSPHGWSVSNSSLLPTVCPSHTHPSPCCSAALG